MAINETADAADSAKRPQLAAVVWLLAAVKLGLHLATARAYGWHGDELYFQACADRLAWGYVDHPPLSIALLEAWAALGGTGLLWTRFPAALAGAAVVMGTALIAREFGGRAWAQGLAALVALAAPVMLAMHGYASMNAYDGVFWTLAMWLSLRLAAEPGAKRTWLALGLVMGLGLLNKWTVSWLGAGLLVGCLATRQRRVLATPWPWVAVAVAALIIAPHLLWQGRHGWPTLMFFDGLTRDQLESVWPLGPLKLVLEQASAMNPVAAPVWGIGLYALLRDGTRAGARILGIVFVVVVAILTINGAARVYYLSLAQPPLIAAGAVWIVDRAATLRRGKLHLSLYVASVALIGAVLSPLTLRLLRPESLVAYQAVVNPLEGHSKEKRLDDHFSLYFGWPELAEDLAEIYAELPAEQREGLPILALSYADAAALERYGPAHGLPPVFSGHNSYWLWGPPELQPAAVIIVGGYGVKPEVFAPAWEHIEEIGRARCVWCHPTRADRAIWLARGHQAPLREMWPGFRHYH